MEQSEAIDRAEGRCPSTLAGIRVLLVEDDPLSREGLALVLAAHGAVVECAAAVPQALALLEARAPHIVISDIGLPGIDGYDLVRRIRGAAGPGEHLAVLAISGFSDITHARARATGFDAFLCKPVDIDRLVALVRRLVSV